MDRRVIEPFVRQFFDSEILSSLMNFVKIPNCSPEYDPDWDKNGYQIAAAQYIQDWIKNQNLKGCDTVFLKDEGRTPFIYVNIEGTKEGDDRCILLYAHMDKQPPLTGWSPGLGPYTPVIKDGHLYGRGSSDDGYAPFAAITAVKACQDNNWPLPRIGIILEASEESGSTDLKYYLEKLSKLIGNPSLIFGLDSSCIDYNRLWTTSSLRGVFSMNLKVSLLKLGYHSGNGGGFVADSFLVLRMLLDRIEDSKTGKLLDEYLYPTVPVDKKAEIDHLASTMGDHILDGIEFYKNTQPMTNDKVELILNNTWRPTVTITGANGFPELDKAGNVLRQNSEVKISFRLPPLVSAKEVFTRIKNKLTENPPYNAKIDLTTSDVANDGWNQRPFSKDLNNILNDASNKFFDLDCDSYCEGGSIPFVNFFSDKFPKSEVIIMGVTGPGSNIHSTDENLHIEYCKKIICCLTYIISDY
jgi:acetylornithine deacetylase/succinyl-diaminopimelate desuccinylase-like protein